MNHVLVGALAGFLLACGVLVMDSARRRLRSNFMTRLAPYVREQPRTSGLLRAAGASGQSRTVSAGILSFLVSAATVLDRLGSFLESVRRRLATAGGGRTLEQLRLEQMLWAGTGLALGAGLSPRYPRPSARRHPLRR